MTINRHNYETYFLLHIDNELSVQQQEQLYEFITANPDLKNELELLQQSILKPEHISFTEKESLFKQQEPDAVLIEKLLLLVDEELPLAEQPQLKILIKNDAIVNLTWNQLQQTKLAPDDTIVFEDKASLYRREDRPVIAFRWWAVAVAAMLIGFGVWGSIRFFNQGNSNLNSDISVVQPIKNIENTATVLPPEKAAKITADAVSKIIDSPIISAKNIVHLPASEKNKVQLIKQNKLPVKATYELVKTVEPLKVNGNNLPKSYLENINNKASNKTTIAIVKQENKNEAVENNFVKNELPANNFEKNNAIAMNASFTSNQNFENKITNFDEGDETENKSKLKGFFKRVKRVLERNTMSKSGEGNLKIANLSFAMQ